MKSQTVKAVSKRYEKELQDQYGKVVYVGSGFGFHNEIEGDPHDFLYVFTNDAEIRSKIPTEYGGFPVKVSDIPKAR